MKFKRCKNNCKFIYCNFHKYQIWLLFGSIVTIAGFYHDIFSPIKEYLNPKRILVENLEIQELEELKEVQTTLQNPIYPDYYPVNYQPKPISHFIDSTLLKNYSVKVVESQIKYELKKEYGNKNIPTTPNIKLGKFDSKYTNGKVKFLLSNLNTKTMIVEDVIMDWKFNLCYEILIDIIEPQRPYIGSLVETITYKCNLTRENSSLKLNDKLVQLKHGEANEIIIELDFPHGFGKHIFKTIINYRYLGENKIHREELNDFERDLCYRKIVNK